MEKALLLRFTTIISPGGLLPIYRSCAIKNPEAQAHWKL